MARGEFTAEEALRVHASFNRVLNLVPRKLRRVVVEETLDVYRFLEAARARTPDADRKGGKAK